MVKSKSLLVVERSGKVALAAPRMVTSASEAAAFAWEEFFIGKIRNPHTRAAYRRAVRRFLVWCEPQEVELARITPGMVGRYFDELAVSIPSKKLHLAAIRGFLDVLVQRHVIVLNPALSVRTERYSVMEGRTPEITVEQAKTLLGSITLTSVVDYRDRALIAVLVYTAARAGAVARLRLQDLIDEGTQFSLRFAEKGGKMRAIPVRHDLEKFLSDYLVAGGLTGEPKESPLFRTAAGRKLALSARAMNGVDVYRVVKRRLRAAKLTTLGSPHSFRVLAATDLLRQGISLEEVQYLLGHSDARTTRLYNRQEQRVTRNLVERISV